uniref:Kinesin motor domain-containing protein n=1 Tax=Rhabditophanes sp. KR3021 TaxID=114890 RepID=A0AC35TZV2_9BILA
MDRLRVGISVSFFRSNNTSTAGVISDLFEDEELIKIRFEGNDGSMKSKKVYLCQLMDWNPHLFEEEDKKSEKLLPKSRPITNQNNYADLPSFVDLDISCASSYSANTDTQRTVIQRGSVYAPAPVKPPLPKLPSKSIMPPVQPLHENVASRHQMETIPKNNPHFEYHKMILEHSLMQKMEPLVYRHVEDEARMKVFIRVRPLNSADIANQEIKVLTIPNAQTLFMHQPQTKVNLQKYLTTTKVVFDGVFHEGVTNDCVYENTAKPLLNWFFEKSCVTCFAYGQTGSGKTYTMNGEGIGTQHSGIYSLTCKDIFSRMNQERLFARGFTIECGFFEIYMNKAYDLLNERTELKVQADHNDEVQISGLKRVTCNKPEDVMRLVSKGSKKRSTGSTKANAQSSRSHAIFQFMLVKNEQIISKCSLVDLAGSERGCDAGNVDKTTRNEGNAINKSLLALKECIRYMSLGNSERIPFRNSALTQFLKDSFIGEKAKLCMIAMVSPAVSSSETTLNSIKYAEQVSKISGREILLSMDASIHEDSCHLNSSSDLLDSYSSAHDKTPRLKDVCFYVGEIKKVLVEYVKKLDEFEVMRDNATNLQDNQWEKAIKKIIEPQSLSTALYLESLLNKNVKQ